jgi:hypothetical protein
MSMPGGAVAGAREQWQLGIYGWNLEFKHWMELQRVDAATTQNDECYLEK